MTAPHANRAAHLAEFIQGYMNCALYASTDDDGDHLDAKYDVDDFSAEARGKSEIDCIVFFTENEQDLYDAWRERDFSFHSAGHDFWLRRNGHGAGFWDRDNLKGGLGERFTNACKRFGQVDVYVGDDGKVHL